MTQRFGYLPMSMSNLIRRFAWQRSARRRKDARSPQTVEVLPPKTRRRLFIKYVALFVAVVWVALLSNGVFDVFFYYQEKTSLIRILIETAGVSPSGRRARGRDLVSCACAKVSRRGRLSSLF